MKVTQGATWLVVVVVVVVVVVAVMAVVALVVVVVVVVVWLCGCVGHNKFFSALTAKSSMARLAEALQASASAWSALSQGSRLADCTATRTNFPAFRATGKGLRGPMGFGRQHLRCIHDKFL